MQIVITVQHRTLQKPQLNPELAVCGHKISVAGC